ncbi:hypothetical protein ABL840_24055 [Variovorax sp. NFACC27]|jgi:hypothetical protein|nr:hypothetical protein [Variovorax sp. YR750]MDP9602967.1 hypothetical protein [Variovorax paradoxus]
MRIVGATHFLEAETVLAVLAMARLAAALVVDFTRIPSSIDVTQL